MSGNTHFLFTWSTH